MQYHFLPNRPLRTTQAKSRARRASTGITQTRAEDASIPCFRPVIGEVEIDAVNAVLRSGWLTTGAKAREFEQKFSEFMGGEAQAVAVNSATAGLHLAAEACGIG